MERLRTFFEQLRDQVDLAALARWVATPPGLYVLAGLVVAVLLLLAWRLLRGRGTSARVMTRRQARVLRKNGDYRGLGDLYEEMGDTKAALRAYQRGGCHAERVALLLRLDKRKQAKRAAKEGEVWDQYAYFCEEDGETAAAAEAYERGGQTYSAARCYEALGERLKAAKMYLEHGMPDSALPLIDGEGKEIAALLERTLRTSLEQLPKGAKSSAETVQGIRRCARMWVEAGEPQRAYRLAFDCSLWDIAVPIARDRLPPSLELAETCRRANAHGAAASIYEKLGETRQAALCRADHYIKEENASEAAQWLETAEEWGRAADQRAAAGQMRRAAELYAKAGDFYVAAELYGHLGDAESKDAMLREARSRDPHARTVREPTAPAATAPNGAPTEPQAPLPVGGGRYTLRAEIGRGGMGVVYRAVDQVLKRDVAYKVLPADLAEAEGTSLLEEARAVARLSHPNIVQVYDAGQDHRGYFIVMELIEGRTFADLLKKRQLSVKGAVHVARQICAALAHAHARRIIHRDIKPSNLLWAADKRVKLTDFGLARVFEETIGSVQTRSAGTPSYMAPEQIKGGAVDPRTDIYALGCVLYELLVNRAPFPGGSSVYHHLNTTPELPSGLRDDVPEALASLVMRCLEKNPDQRPRTVVEVAEALTTLA